MECRYSSRHRKDFREVCRSASTRAEKWLTTNQKARTTRNVLVCIAECATTQRDCRLRIGPHASGSNQEPPKRHLSILAPPAHHAVSCLRRQAVRRHTLCLAPAWTPPLPFTPFFSSHSIPPALLPPPCARFCPPACWRRWLPLSPVPRAVCDVDPPPALPCRRCAVSARQAAVGGPAICPPFTPRRGGSPTWLRHRQTEVSHLPTTTAGP